MNHFCLDNLKLAERIIVEELEVSDLRDTQDNGYFLLGLCIDILHKLIRNEDTESIKE